MVKLEDISIRLDALRKVGKAEKAERLMAEFLAELDQPLNPTFKVDLGGGKFKRDFAKEGFDLVSDVEPLCGEYNFEIVQILNDGESSVSGPEMRKRATTLGANLGQRDGENENLLASIPKELRDCYILLPGTSWVRRDTRELCVAFLIWNGERWVVELYCLDDDVGSLVRFLVPRKL